jgi:CRP/FNR family transcriptional regulator
MNNQVTISRLFPSFQSELQQEIALHSKISTLSPQTRLLQEGAGVSVLPFVMEGMVKVTRSDQDKEILLYYIRPGESCVMSFTACVMNSKSRINAITETDSTILLVPAYLIHDYLRKYPELNQYFHQLYNQRYTELLETVDQLVFHTLDERLRYYLREKVDRLGNNLKITHAEIAQDLGTAREVVSRVLKKLEKEGEINLMRNEIRWLGKKS